MNWKEKIRVFLEIPSVPVQQKFQLEKDSQFTQTVKETVKTLFEKYVFPVVEELVNRHVADHVDAIIEAKLRTLLVKSHDEWTKEMTAALLRHVNEAMK